MLKNHSYSLYYAIGTILLLALACFVAVLLYRNIRIVGEEVLIAERSIASLEEQERAIIQNRKLLDASSDIIKDIESVFLSDDTFVRFIEMLERFAGISGVVLETRSAEPASGKEKNKTVVKFEVRGEFGAISRFFILLDESVYSGMIEDLRIAPAGKGTNILRAQASFVIFSFTQAL